MSMTTPVSSRNSRTAASTGDSPGSTPPPGVIQIGGLVSSSSSIRNNRTHPSGSTAMKRPEGRGGAIVIPAASRRLAGDGPPHSRTLGGEQCLERTVGEPRTSMLGPELPNGWAPPVHVPEVRLPIGSDVAATQHGELRQHI